MIEPRKDDYMKIMEKQINNKMLVNLLTHRSMWNGKNLQCLEGFTCGFII